MPCEWLLMRAENFSMEAQTIKRVFSGTDPRALRSRSICRVETGSLLLGCCSGFLDEHWL